MIPQERCIRRSDESDEALRGKIASEIQRLIIRPTSVSQPLFTLYSMEGTANQLSYERGRLQEIGFEAMEEFGLDVEAARPDERVLGLNDKGVLIAPKSVREYLVYPSNAKGSIIEFTRETLYVHKSQNLLEDINKMNVVRVKWGVRVATDPNFLDGIHP